MIHRFSSANSLRFIESNTSFYKRRCCLAPAKQRLDHSQFTHHAARRFFALSTLLGTRRIQGPNTSSRLPMKIIVSAILSIMLVGFADNQTAYAEQATPGILAGKIIAGNDCKGCHGLDGKGVAHDIPHLAAQVEAYLLASLHAYKEGKRTHAALKDMTAHMSDADMRNVAAYYASLPPVEDAAEKEPLLSYAEKGRAKAAACAACHGADGNSKMPGMPSLAGQQPHYLVDATQAYMDGARNMPTMTPMLKGLSRADVENIAVYYALQTPTQRKAPSFGDATAGEPLSATCGGCHGYHGVSKSAAIPSLAGQDAKYLLAATKAYRDGARKHDVMQGSVADGSDKDIENLAAYYAVQKPQIAEFEKPIATEKLAELCDRCHGPGVDNPALVVPKLRGQNRDYLVKALRAYRDDNRDNSMMHKMSLPHSDAIIEGIASFYASQPTR